LDELTQEFETLAHTVDVRVGFDSRNCLLDEKLELGRVVKSMETQI
jgi:hypothetical protein